MLNKNRFKHDLYRQYQTESGALTDINQRRRYYIQYIDIDSKNRRIEPKLELDEAILLQPNALVFTKNSNIVTITHKNHEYTHNDLIMLTGVIAKQCTLRTYISHNNPTFEIILGYNIMKINYKHGIPLDYNEIDNFVKFEGIKGDTNTSSLLGNIPVNLINAQHKIKLCINHHRDYDKPNENYFFILLPSILHTNYILRDYNFKMTFESLAGIPLNQINASYPKDINNLSEYHIIKNITTHSYDIEFPNNAMISIVTGGKNIYVTKILSFDKGYPNPNNYVIDLNTAYNNILNIRLISTIIPNTINAIRDYPTERINNKLYWNNIDDGDHLYELNVPVGTYDSHELEQILEKEFGKVRRINHNSYESKHIMKVKINTARNRVVFKSYKKIILQHKNFHIDKENNEITITHCDHNIIINNNIRKIKIKICYSNICVKGVIKKIINDHKYTVDFDCENLNNIKNIKKNDDDDYDDEIVILISDIFRLRFDQPNTIGRILGFRHVGASISITKFSDKISNQNSYEFELTEKNIIASNENNIIQLYPEDYIIMVLEPLKTYSMLGKIKDAFAKILLCDRPGKFLFDTFVPMDNYFQTPLHELTQLKVSFYTPDGILIDFHGLDHSFTLEIISVDDIPDGSGIASSTGKNYNESIRIV